MPRYTYENRETNERIERTVSIFNNLPSEVVIDGRVYTRVFDLPTVIYNSTGFYSTDNLNSIEKWRKEHLQGE